ncbi:SMG6 nonsense mediated mRNA decay factor [Phyllostomus discolor]|uniref:SMG6 nonsense mediated mRNA decay factor n=1 Tax=Phyllostomus discolor TaxID=89673 RepID=A0A834DYW3_9CHIR|nr:SMG6 nonsense mediated mRNA decay factor [Phyllostomus discolor]
MNSRSPQPSQHPTVRQPCRTLPVPHCLLDREETPSPRLRKEPIRLLREVVLLTDDRNLRVKALTRNVPVRDIPAFLAWAQVG